jgi:hypothetical protein
VDTSTVPIPAAQQLEEHLSGQLANATSSLSAAVSCKRAKRHRGLRQSPSVTHQGSRQPEPRGSLVLKPQPKAKLEKIRGQILCSICQSPCSPFARVDFWRGGRGYKKLKRRINEQRDRGRSPPPVPRRRLATQHHRKTTLTASFSSSKGSGSQRTAAENFPDKTVESR